MFLDYLFYVFVVGVVSFAYSVYLTKNMSDDDMKSRHVGSEKGFMCGVCEGQLISAKYFDKFCTSNWRFT